MSNYQEKMKELKNTGKEINSSLQKYKKIIDSNSKENTILFEKDLQSKLNSFESDLNQLNSDYSRKATTEIQNLPSNQVDKRLKEIHNLMMDKDRNKMLFENYKSQKYSFKVDESKYNNYEDRDEFKGKSTGQLMEPSCSIQA